MDCLFPIMPRQLCRELAQQGSDNHRVLADLIDQGARLTGTESPELLMEEYQLNRRILHQVNRPSQNDPRRRFPRFTVKPVSYSRSTTDLSPVASR